MTAVTPSYRRRRRWPIGVGLAVAVVAGAAVAVWQFSGATLAADDVALAHVSLQPFAGSIGAVTASEANGRTVSLTTHGGNLTPLSKLSPGEVVRVHVVIRRPGWLSWALGRERHETLTVRAPVVHVVNRWPTVAAGAPVRVRFSSKVTSASLGRRTVQVDGRTLLLPGRAPAGSVEIAAAARPWERFGPPEKVTWFPASAEPAVLAEPAPAARIAPMTPLRLTFSRPTSEVLNGREPTLTPHVAGHWSEVDDHSLVFQPSGFGMPFAQDVRVTFPRRVTVASTTRATARTATGFGWTVAPASFLRLQQLLAQEGYLPLAWQPAQGDAANTVRAQLAAAVAAPAGRFSWRYANTPSELVALWKTGEPNVIMRGAVMMFQHEHDLAVDGIAGPQVWRAVLADALAGKRHRDAYSYVYVHRAVPQRLTLWHAGQIVLTSPGNTGVPAAPTALGTWPVFEHIPVGRMSGTNPDGTHYDDPGIRWISYFHGGEALHAFNRSSFGTPQSLGCVELPLAAAAKAWPYTPIGTLVTIEN